MNRAIVVLFFLLSANCIVGQITEIGLASFYADKYDGRVTASGDIFDQGKMTAAHRTLPFGSKVKITSLENNKTIIVIINDRGPFVDDRVIDLSKAGAKKLDFISKGVAKVKIEVLSVPEGKQSKPKPYKPERKAKTIEPKITTETVGSGQVIEYFKVESKQIEPEGFGIQVASYKEAANLIKRCDELRKSTGTSVIIQVANSDGEKVYRIILGPFETKELASETNEKLQSSFNGSFVISLK